MFTRLASLIVVLSACSHGPSSNTAPDKSATQSESKASLETTPDKNSDVPKKVVVSLEDWGKETIALPPEFAPKMQWSGQEELLFAPGMFRPTEPDFFSYAFVLRYPSQASVSPEKLAELIKHYYSGLMSAVAKGKKELDSATKTLAGQASVTIVNSGKTIQLLIETFDSFATMKPIALQMRASIETIGSGICVRAAVSPQSSEHKVWGELDVALASLPCTSEK